MKRPDIGKLEKDANQLRKDVLTILTKAGSGHTGSSLSCIEIILTIYSYKLRLDPKNPKMENRDRFVLSKGHGCPALYTVLAHFGFFPKKRLSTLRELGSSLQGHPQLGLPGLEASTGSLGQGLSIANGMALAARLDKKDTKVYCLMGDGETNEGQVWEAAMTAAHYKLDNLCAFIDFNKLQIDGFLCDVKNIEPLADKWSSFGWHVIEIDGHDLGQIMDALDEAEKIKKKPVLILAHTVKGKGVSFIENKAEWHGIAPSPEELKKALEELETEKE
ncbi:MAG: transketolase [Candidatus Omnitrophica bacterium]|nr:transketolase [Candidatus Omnitrophota bacterium]